MAAYDQPGFTEQLPGLKFSHGAGMTAPGTATNPDTSVGEVIASPPVSATYVSVQPGVPHVAVTSGDTCSLSSDAPVPASGDPLTGLSLAQVTHTGAGEGHVNGPPHPTAGVGLPGRVS